MFALWPSPSQRLFTPGHLFEFSSFPLQDADTDEVYEGDELLEGEEEMDPNDYDDQQWQRCLEREKK